MSQAERLIRVSAALQEAQDMDALAAIFQKAVAAETRYRTAWLFELLPTRESLRMISISGAGSAGVEAANTAIIPVGADPMLNELLQAESPMVVVDARTDPRTDKRMVALHGNRTIVNIPLGFVGAPMLIVGAGTFAPEPPIAPTEADVSLLSVLGSLVSVAASRLRFVEAQRAAEAERRRLEAQILHAQKLESLGLLAGGIAHDFNNILSAILGNCDLGMMADEPDEVAESFQQIQLAVFRARALTGQMLAYAGKGLFLVRDVDLAECTRELVRFVQAASSRSITWEVSGELCGARGDDSQLRQIIMNLLTNAADAIGSRPGRVSAALEVVAQLPAASWVHASPHPGPFALLRVEDTGGGIPPEIQARIFDPFFSTKGAGRGLGLASVMGILSQHSGALAVDSTPGTGTRFLVALPHAALREQPASPEAPRTRSGRLLVADDDPGIRAALEASLSRAGYTVTVARDGDEALRLLQQGAFHAAVLDVLMPRRAGTEVARALRALGADTPVLLMSGYPDEFSATSLPGVGFLPKPISLKALLGALDGLLDAGQ